MCVSDARPPKQRGSDPHRKSRDRDSQYDTPGNNGGRACAQCSYLTRLTYSTAVDTKSPPCSRCSAGAFVRHLPAVSVTTSNFIRLRFLPLLVGFFGATRRVLVPLLLVGCIGKGHDSLRGDPFSVVAPRTGCCLIKALLRGQSIGFRHASTDKAPQTYPKLLGTG